MDYGTKLAYTTTLVLLVLLAVSSGITKIALLQHDVDFFGKYGFSDPILIAFGVIQLIGGVLLAFKRTRFFAAVIVAVTFLVSLAVLLMDGNIPASVATVVATLLLGMVMKQSWNRPATEA